MTSSTGQTCRWYGELATGAKIRVDAAIETVTGEDSSLLQILRIRDNTAADDFAIRLQRKIGQMDRVLPGIKRQRAVHTKTWIDMPIRMVSDQNKSMLTAFLVTSRIFDPGIMSLPSGWIILEWTSMRPVLIVPSDPKLGSRPP